MENVRRWSAAEGDDYEIVVVTPQSETVDLEHPKVIWVRTERLFPPGAMRNRGVAIARGEHLVFCDDDVEVDVADMRSLTVRAKSEGPRVAVGCRVCARYSFWAHCADYCLFSCYQGFDEAWDVVLGSALLVVDRNIFTKLGGFDEALLACEDWDFCMKLKRNGGVTLFVPTVEAVHRHGRERLRATLACSYRYGSLAGMTVQERYPELTSARARLNTALPGPFWSALKLLPQSAYYCLQVAQRSLRRDPILLCYLPMVFLSRAFFLAGTARPIEKT